MPPALPSNDDFPPDYDQRIERVCNQAAEDFRACRGDLLAQLHACARYFQHGAEEDIDHGLLVDLLGVDSTVLIRAGYTDAEVIQVMTALPLLVVSKDGVCRAPDALPAPTPIPTTTQFTLDL